MNIKVNKSYLGRYKLFELLDDNVQIAQEFMNYFRFVLGKENVNVLSYRSVDFNQNGERYQSIELLTKEFNGNIILFVIVIPDKNSVSKEIFSVTTKVSFYDEFGNGNVKIEVLAITEDKILDNGSFLTKFQMGSGDQWILTNFHEIFILNPFNKPKYAKENLKKFLEKIEILRKGIIMD